MIPSFNQVLLESSLDITPFKAGFIYICNNTGHIYLDSIIERRRILLTGSAIVILDENTREELTNHVQNKLYFVQETESFYIFLGDKWYIISNGTSNFSINRTSESAVAITTDDNGSFVIPLDNTLAKQGVAADAKAVGDAINNINLEIEGRVYIGTEEPSSTVYNLWIDTSNTTALIKYRNASGSWSIIYGTNESNAT